MPYTNLCVALYVTVYVCVLALVFSITPSFLAALICVHLYNSVLVFCSCIESCVRHMTKAVKTE